MEGVGLAQGRDSPPTPTPSHLDGEAHEPRPDLVLTGRLAWLLPASPCFSEGRVPEPLGFPAVTSCSWMCFQIPRRSRRRLHPLQMESLRLLLRAQQPRPRPSRGDAGNIRAQHRQLEWGWQDVLGFPPGPFFSWPQHASCTSQPSHHPPYSAPLSGPPQTLRGKPAGTVCPGRPKNHSTASPARPQALSALACCALFLLS